MNDYLDSVSTKIYYQHTEAHDWTYMPDSVTRRMQTVNSNYDTDTPGPAGRAGENPGPPRSERRFQRQHQQNPAAVQPVADPQRLQRDHAAGGRQPQLHPRRLCPRIRSTSISTATTSPLFPACAWCINRLSRKICPISPPTAAC
ncbi:hypothetical protein IE991_13480 [Klebsiella pneumoniae]|uniref:Uncharacterized protein n=1 Tax=Klebsiella pneumoniae TaxID=573 RepID=A0A927HH90_KLEPN|nr:hypothetical protein [Klebsiella pneumoniae]